MRKFVFALAVLVTISAWQPGQGATPAIPPNRAKAPEKLPPPPAAEVLAKVVAPPIRPVIKTKQGYQVEVDLSKQILMVHSPKKDLFVSPRVDAQQTVEVIFDGAPLQYISTVVAKLKKGRLLYTTAAEGDWVLTQIVDGGEVKRGWVQKHHVTPTVQDFAPQKYLQRGDNFASAAMLIQKGKQFDDGLYAAVELAMQNGLGPVTGKREWLPRLAGKVDIEAGGVPLAQLYAATHFSGHKAQLAAAISKLKDAELAAFLADETRSKPLGFYSWSSELESIFRQDRMLQSSLDTKQHAAGIVAVAQALAADAEARQSYEQVMRLNERLTNKLTGPGYREFLIAINAGKTPNLPPDDPVSFFPASRSHETDLIKKLYGFRAIPAGYDLMSEVIKRLKDGQLSFEPRDDSGWYDHQLWSVESLVRFDLSAEAKQLQPNDAYLKHLEELFKGTYALMRETHVKQLERPLVAASAAPPPRKEREKVYISPQPHVELLPTMYVRRAESYRFVRKALEETFGKEHVAQMHRRTAHGPVEMNLADELDLQERLFSGAYVVACRELGLPENLPAGLGAGQTADEQAQVFLRWVASLASDPDLAPDCRMMVPVFYDEQRKKTKVWVILGWDQANCSLNYARHPGIQITGPDGKPASGEDAPEIIFQGSYRGLGTPVFAEVYVNKLLNRAEFRRHCDAYRTKGAILANLE